MLSIRHLDVYYGPVRALTDVSLEVPAGKIVTLLGANGAGKTTTLRAISCLQPPQRGEVYLEERLLNRCPPEEVVARGVVQVPEGRQIFAHLSVEENLRLGLYSRRDKYQAARELARVLDFFPALAPRLRQSGGTLSGGEQQMLAIGRALMAKPRLLLLDEPSLGLAPKIVQDIFRIIRALNADGVTILLVEQNANMALKVADYAYVLENGRVAMAGAAASLLQDDKVKQSYLGKH